MEGGLAAHLKAPSSWQGTKRRGSWGRAAGLVTLVMIWFSSPKDVVGKFGAGQQREAIQLGGGKPPPLYPPLPGSEGPGLSLPRQVGNTQTKGMPVGKALLSSPAGHPVGRSLSGDCNVGRKELTC